MLHNLFKMTAENILEVLKASLHKAQKKRKAPCTPVT